MQIKELTLQTRYLAGQKAFYHTLLDLPLMAETTDSFTIQAGTTRLRFQETQQDVLYHLALSIPGMAFQEAKQWVRERVSLLAVTKSRHVSSPEWEWNKVGEDEIFFPVANARSFYVRDAGKNILKFVVYYESQDTAGANDAAFVLSVNEIGLPVEDVLQSASRLQEQLGIEPYPISRPASKEFAFLGDASGQLVVVRISHAWMPTETVKATVAPVHLTIRGQREHQIQFSPYPYTITVVAS